MWVLAGECRSLLLYGCLPQIPPTCHCNYFSISSLLDQNLLLSKEIKPVLSVTWTSAKSHPAPVRMHGKHSERGFSTKEARAILLGLLFRQSAVKRVNAVYKHKEESGLSRAGLSNGLGCLSFLHLSIFVVITPFFGLRWDRAFLAAGCVTAWAAVSPLTAWSQLESLDIAKINPNRHHSAWQALSWAGM